MGVISRAGDISQEGVIIQDISTDIGILSHFFRRRLSPVLYVIAHIDFSLSESSISRSVAAEAGANVGNRGRVLV